MAGRDEPLRCPRCGRRARVLDLTATSITCADCDPAWEALRHGERPRFGGAGDDDRDDRDAEEDAPPERR